MFADDTQPRADLHQHRHMHALWRTAGVTDRDQRLALTAAAIGREVTTSADLTATEADQLIDYMRILDQHGVLAQRAGEYLAAQRAKVSV